MPPGVTLRDARAVLPEARLFLANGSVAAFADLFRYRLLRDLGGWWADADVVCLRPDLPARPLFLAWQDGGLINNAVLRAPAGHRFPARLAAEAERLGPSEVWGTLGPMLVTRVARELRLAARAAAPGTAYPVPWPQALALLDPGRRAEVEARAAEAHFLHLWNEIWRQGSVDKHAAPPPGSFARDLLDRYG